MTAPSIPPPRARRRGQEGPPLWIPALSFAGLTVAGAVIGAGGPRPDSAPDDVLAYAVANPVLAAVGPRCCSGPRSRWSCSRPRPSPATAGWASPRPVR
jgi:hypothetical protein